MKIQNTAVALATSCLLLAVTASAAENAECIQAKQRAEVVGIADLSQTIQLPVLAADGKTIQAIETLKTSSFKVTLIGQDGMEFALILPKKPARKVLETSVEVCTSAAQSRLKILNDFTRHGPESR